MLAVEREPQPTHWYSGTEGRHRIKNITITAAFAAVYATSIFVVVPRLAPTSCRWCEPLGFDRSVRDAVVWKDRARANFLSNVDTYLLAPAVGFGLLIAVDHDAGWGRFLDDTIPVAATVAFSQTITQIVKLSVGRSRPDAQFGAPGRAATKDDNLSFFSGHSALGFSITASAGLISHWRHYWTEPYVWGAGIALSVSTEYLRMGADKHYLSDVLVGGGVGLASGLLIPRLMRQDLKIVPGKQSVGIVGSF